MEKASLGEHLFMTYYLSGPLDSSKTIYYKNILYFSSSDKMKEFIKRNKDKVGELFRNGCVGKSEDINDPIILRNIDTNIPVVEQGKAFLDYRNQGGDIMEKMWREDIPDKLKIEFGIDENDEVCKCPKCGTVIYKDEVL